VFKVIKVFTNSILISGKTLSSERLLKFLIKCLLKAKVKSSYKLFKLLSSYISSTINLTLKSQELSNKLASSFNYNLCFSFKSLVNNTKLNNKYISSVLFNINKLIIIRKEVYTKLFEYNRVLLFYRW
jgi:hypothetical protein